LRYYLREGAPCASTAYFRTRKLLTARSEDDDLEKFSKRGPGRPKLDKTLEAVTLRLDRAVVEHFRAQGADWRKRMARVLAKAAS
jgi:uncharacterized protein (DUF4415 family)